MSHQPKLVIVGDGGVGKSSFVRRLVSGEFEDTYDPTMDVDVQDYKYGNCLIKCWDTAGQDQGGIVRELHLSKASAAIIMFDVTCRVTYKNVDKWYKQIVRDEPEIPIVLCGNKVDMARRSVKETHVNFHKDKDIPYFEISVKTNKNFDKPFLYLAEKLGWDPDQLIEQHSDVNKEATSRCCIS
jgi:GTP-binding nuclear protein Ran